MFKVNLAGCSHVHHLPTKKSWKGNMDEITMPYRERGNLSHLSREVRNIIDSKCLEKRGYVGLSPLLSKSHHQDCYVFRLGDPNLNLHLPLESWEGGQPKGYVIVHRNCSQLFTWRIYWFPPCRFQSIKLRQEWPLPYFWYPTEN